LFAKTRITRIDSPIPTVTHNYHCKNNIHHGKIIFATAKYNCKQQIQITPGKLQTFMAKTKKQKKTISTIQN